MPDREVVWVTPVGELDLATTVELDEQVRELLDVRFAQLVIDLRGLSFMDVTGLRLLLCLAEQARRDGWELSLIQGGDQLRRIFAPRPLTSCRFGPPPHRCPDALRRVGAMASRAVVPGRRLALLATAPGRPLRPTRTGPPASASGGSARQVDRQGDLRNGLPDPSIEPRRVLTALGVDPERNRRLGRS